MDGGLVFSDWNSRHPPLACEWKSVRSGNQKISFSSPRSFVWLLLFLLVITMLHTSMLDENGLGNYVVVFLFVEVESFFSTTGWWELIGVWRSGNREEGKRDGRKTHFHVSGREWNPMTANAWLDAKFSRRTSFPLPVESFSLARGRRMLAVSWIILIYLPITSP